MCIKWHLSNSVNRVGSLNQLVESIVQKDVNTCTWHRILCHPYSNVVKLPWTLLLWKILLLVIIVFVRFVNLENFISYHLFCLVLEVLLSPYRWFIMMFGFIYQFYLFMVINGMFTLMISLLGSHGLLFLNLLLCLKLL